MQNEIKISKKISIVFILIILVVFSSYSKISAQNETEIRLKIDKTNESKIELEKEIERYQNELKNIDKQANTLQNTIKTLETTEKKLNADIKLTEKNIQTTELNIQSLIIEIEKKEETIGKNSLAIGKAMREINESDQTTLVESLLSYDSLSSFWNETETLYKVQESLKTNLVQNKEAKTALEKDKVEAENQKKKLESLRIELADKRTILQNNKKEQNRLLSETKNKESNYKTLLSEKEALKNALDRELTQYESELKFILDKSTLPKVGSGVLSWPLDKVFITQPFGMTDFAKSGAYNGKAHNGVDFRATIGTKIKSSGSGIIKGVGDTDTVCPGASWGKWVLIDHGNGLSTMYGHMSLIKVTEGQKITVGDTIGYSGNTGYSTGPHLHLTVYASEGVKVTNLKSSVCRGTYRIPIASPSAYLDPMLYL